MIASLRVWHLFWKLVKWGNEWTFFHVGVLYGIYLQYIVEIRRYCKITAKVSYATNIFSKETLYLTTTWQHVLISENNSRAKWIIWVRHGRRWQKQSVWLSSASAAHLKDINTQIAPFLFIMHPHSLGWSLICCRIPHRNLLFFSLFCEDLIISTKGMEIRGRDEKECYEGFKESSIFLRQDNTWTMRPSTKPLTVWYCIPSNKQLHKLLYKRY